MLRRWAGPALLAAIVILFQWKLVLTNQYTWLEGSDTVTQILPWYQYQAGEWHQGRFPMWDPTSWFGQPLAGQGQPGSSYPPNWLLFLWPLDHGWMQQAPLHWYYVLIRLFAALTMYALCRDLGRSHAAAILAGCLYALGGYIGNTDWPQMVHGAVWSPLAFLYLLRAERGENPWPSALLSGFFLGIGWLAGHHQMNLFVTLAAAALWLWLIVRKGRIHWQMAKLSAASMVVMVLASGFQTLPMYEFGKRAERWVSLNDPVSAKDKVPYVVHNNFSLNPDGLLAIFIPNLEVRSTPFIGIVGFSLGILGVILCWRERQIRWLAMIAGGGLLFALGGNDVFHGMIYALVPLVETARVPAAATLVFALGIAPLAAFGLDALPRPESLDWSQRAGRVLLAAAAILAMLSLVFVAAGVKGMIADQRLMITALAALACAGILAAWRQGGITVTAGSVGLLAFALIEIGNVTNYYLPNRAVPEVNTRLHTLADYADIAAYIQGRGEQGRAEIDGDAIAFNFGAWYGIEVMNAPGASILENIWNMDLFTGRTRDFFGIRYWIGKKPNRPDQAEVFRGRAGMNVYENPGAFPRAFTVHQVMALGSLKEIRSKFSDPAVDLRKTALVQQRAAVENCSGNGDNVEMPQHSGNYVRIEADLECRGLLILTDSSYPGWRASVDGKPAAILEVNGGVRGVVVDKGQHRVEFRYRPLSLFAGLAMTLAACATALGAVILGRRQAHAH